MKVNGQHCKTIWLNEDKQSVCIIDQRFLPHQFIIEHLSNTDQVAEAIKDMHVRGAGLIGVCAAWGMYLAGLEAERKNMSIDAYLPEVAQKLILTRPTAVNLSWAVHLQLDNASKALSAKDKIAALLKGAEDITEFDLSCCQKIGLHGLQLIQDIARQKKAPVNILTHCNAGWLAFVDYGSATAPIYAAFDQGIAIHVWVDETRPRNQGARLTAWELAEHGVPHTVIPDNTGGHLMQKGMVDLVIVGSDRTSPQGDVANKIGTYLKALAAHDNQIPFYVALPSSSFDWSLRDAFREIPIEQRDPSEVTHISGWHEDKELSVRLTPHKSAAVNYGFDITPARLVTALITERGVCDANAAAIKKLFPEKF